MSYYHDSLGAVRSHRKADGKVISREHRGSGAPGTKTPVDPAAAPAAAPPSGGIPKMLIFAGLGVAALVGFMMLKKKKKGTASSSPSISLFAAPKVA
jgi:hypothetical protein